MDGDDCWLWEGCIDRRGYGRIGRERAHRRMWQSCHGPIPAGMFVCHTCDNPPCVRPDHLFLGTHTDNMRDMVSKGRGRTQRRDPHSVALYFFIDRVSI